MPAPTITEASDITSIAAFGIALMAAAITWSHVLIKYRLNMAINGIAAILALGLTGPVSRKT